jgi:hypothetical protein
MKNIIFVGHSEQGSCKMRGIQVTQALSKYHDIQSPYILKDQFLNNIANIKDSIIIFVGEPLFIVNNDPNIFTILNKNNNVLIYDVIDNYCFSHSNPIINTNLVEVYQLLDVLVHTNTFSEMKTEEILPNVRHLTIPHQWDIDNENLSLPKTKNTNIATYIGGLGGFQLDVNKLEGYVDVYDNPLDGNNQQSKYTIHTSFRANNTLDYFYKPSTKLAVASTFGAILLTSREQSVVDIVGESYEFYIANEDDLISKMDLIRGMSSKQINHYIDNMKNVKEYLSPKQTSNRYNELIKNYI